MGHSDAVIKTAITIKKTINISLIQKWK